ncbi:MAG: type II toxin-antitoxin system VapC family toxin [Pseudonocardiaceae bacterium]
MRSVTAGCVDASLVVRVLDADPAVVPAWERLMRLDGDLIAPSLLHYEVANALHQQQRTGRITEETAQDGLQRVLSLPIELHGDAQLHCRALEIAHERHLPATYDAHYVALAERFRVPLWTCDRKLAAALGEGLPVVHLVPCGPS